MLISVIESAELSGPRSKWQNIGTVCVPTEVSKVNPGKKKKKNSSHFCCTSIFQALSPVPERESQRGKSNEESQPRQRIQKNTVTMCGIQANGSLTIPLLAPFSFLPSAHFPQLHV